MRPILILLAAGLVLAGCSSHRELPPWMQSPDKPRDENYHGGNAAVLLMHYDANHDGTLTKEELASGLKAEFAAHDVRHAGCLDAEQVAEINQARVEADQSTATPIVDWNSDGCVDYTEFSAAPYSLFDQLDANHDGMLTAKELGPAARKRAAMTCTQPQGGHRGRGGRGGMGTSPSQAQCTPSSDAPAEGGEPADGGGAPTNPPPAQ